MSVHSAAATLLVLLFVVGCQGQESSGHPLEEPSGPNDAATSGEVLRIEDPRVNESSGLALSHLHPGVFYTHNDRGRSPEIFAVDASGTRAVLRLETAAMDWEDIASTPDDLLWVGDIGDNDEVRSSVSVTVLDEPPVLVSAGLPSTTYNFRYPDGAHDAETLLVHPRTGRVYIVSKAPTGGTVYAAPRRLSTRKVNLLDAVAEAPPNVTSGGFNADGSLLVLRTHGRAYFYRGFTDSPTELRLPKQPQGESIAFEEDGAYVLIGSEGEDSVILRVAVPAGLNGSRS